VTRPVETCSDSPGPGIPVQSPTPLARSSPLGRARALDRGLLSGFHGCLDTAATLPFFPRRTST